MKIKIASATDPLLDCDASSHLLGRLENEQAGSETLNGLHIRRELRSSSACGPIVSEAPSLCFSKPLPNSQHATLADKLFYTTRSLVCRVGERSVNRWLGTSMDESGLF